MCKACTVKTKQNKKMLKEGCLPGSAGGAFDTWSGGYKFKSHLF